MQIITYLYTIVIVNFLTDCIIEETLDHAFWSKALLVQKLTQPFATLSIYPIYSDSTPSDLVLPQNEYFWVSF